jgi:hypothetical protein
MCSVKKQVFRSYVVGQSKSSCLPGGSGGNWSWDPLFGQLIFLPPDDEVVLLATDHASHSADNDMVVVVRERMGGGGGSSLNWVKVKRKTLDRAYSSSVGTLRSRV